MTVRTTYFGGLGQFDAEYADVLGVVRYSKDFVDRVTDRNVPALAPPSNLLDAYKSVEENPEADGAAYPSHAAWQMVNFEGRFLNYLRSYPGPKGVLDELRDRATECDIWLICWERDCWWCHRRLLANEIVAELEDVEIVHHPDPSTIPVDGDAEINEHEPTLADFAEGGGT